MPHTIFTIKPAGTTSKLFGLTEGAHLPSMREYIRYTQFRNDAPELEKYRRAGYKVKELKTYRNTTVVGFPTRLALMDIALRKNLPVTTASEATPEEQYQWLKLLEEFWIGPQYGNQVSYTLKYDKKDTSKAKFKAMMLFHQSKIKCCSVMPMNEEISAYEYLPEQAVTLEEYNKYVESIKEELAEDVDKVHLDCSTGACPVDFNKE